MADIRQLPLTDKGRKNHDDIFGQKAKCQDCQGEFKTKDLVTLLYLEKKHKEKIVCVGCSLNYKGVRL